MPPSENPSAAGNQQVTVLSSQGIEGVTNGAAVRQIYRAAEIAGKLDDVPDDIGARLGHLSGLQRERVLYRLLCVDQSFPDDFQSRLESAMREYSTPETTRDAR